jgi:SAM-dependent methyltransferase
MARSDAVANVLTKETMATDVANAGSTNHEVVLADGSVRTLAGLTPDGSVRTLAGLTREELLLLQWEQERAFARRILAAAKGSPARAEATRQAYDTVTQIFAAAHGNLGEGPAMGVHPRHARLVVELLGRQRKRGMDARLFEIGFGAGMLLKEVCDAGFAFAGIEVSRAMREKALELLGPEHAGRLYVGDFARDEAPATDGPWSLIYWNDVFEHIPPDEIGDWLSRIHQMLPLGGQLVTITPNWHVRPSDVTVAFCPPRTEAAGLHLREYTLREIHAMLRHAGFASVATPLVVAPRNYVLFGRGLIGLKQAMEPALEWLPFSAARLFCRGLALSCTIATKG